MTAFWRNKVEWINQQQLIRRWDTLTWCDASSYMITYLRQNYDTPVLPEYFLMHTCYIKNGHRFMKNALHILLLSTFRVSSINYSLVCSLPIHTKSPSNEHTVSWNCAKCCTNVRQIAFQKACDLWMTFKVIRGHCHCCHLIDHIRFPINLPL